MPSSLEIGRLPLLPPRVIPRQHASSIIKQKYVQQKHSYARSISTLPHLSRRRRQDSTIVSPSSVSCPLLLVLDSRSRDTSQRINDLAAERIDHVAREDEPKAAANNTLASIKHPVQALPGPENHLLWNNPQPNQRAQTVVPDIIEPRVILIQPCVLSVSFPLSSASPPVQ